MNAIRLHARGGPEAFVYEQAPTPQPGAGEVLVRVHAAAVTPTELQWVPMWTTRAGDTNVASMCSEGAGARPLSGFAFGRWPY